MSECLFEGKDWEGVKSKYEKIKDTFVERYPKVKDGEEVDEDYPKSLFLDEFSRERVAAKLKVVRKKFSKAVDSRKKEWRRQSCNDIL